MKKETLESMTIYEACARCADVINAEVGCGGLDWVEVCYDEVAEMYEERGENRLELDAEWERNKLAMRIVMVMIAQILREE